MKKTHTSTSFYWAISFVIVIPLTICLVLLWIASVRIQDFRETQKYIAHSTIERVAEDIANIIEENRRLVKLFAHNQRGMIARLAQNPDDDQLRQQLKKKIKLYFPHSFAFTIADKHGNPLLDDFDGYIGDICINDLRKMLATKKFAVRIHPNPYVYHYDTMATWERQGKSGIFFVSFAPDMIARLLRAATPAGHQLMLIISEQNDLMEITEHGARNAIFRENYHLNNDERSRILDMTPVKYSLWHLTDLANPGLFSDFRSQTYRTFGTIIISLIVISLSFSFVLVYFEKRRRQAENMRDEMLSLFSHDLRTPLVGIKGAMELLMEHSTALAQERKARLYHLVHDYVIHMSRIVDDILDVHKLESGNMKFNFESVRVADLVDQAVAMVAGYAEQFQVKIDVVHDGDKDIHIRADRQRLTRSLTNLLTNALKFSPAGEIVTVHVHVDKDSVIITIEDHGPGIPLSLQPHIFQKFVQSRHHQIHSLPSTGLGLTIVKYITEAHAGEVRFDSDPDRGTRFILALPFTI